jgi:ribosomal protein S18 acetylase RimI-like enzyme
VKTNILVVDKTDHKAFGVYCQSMAEWPLDEKRFNAIGARNTILALRQNEPVGCALVDVSDSNGYIQLLVVAPEYKGKGIGSLLLASAEEQLSSYGVQRILPGGGTGYLWQGVPEDVAGWFLNQGYTDNELSIDMTMQLGDYVYPAWVENKSPAGLTLRYALLTDATGLYAALQDDDDGDLRGWLGYYTNKMQSQQYDYILLALIEGKIVGFVILLEGDMTWQRCFDGRTGGFGCLGVSNSYRGKGIGRVLASKATLILKQRGLDTSYVGWTWLEDWYGALGYRTWKRFHMMSKTAVK